MSIRFKQKTQYVMYRNLSLKTDEKCNEKNRFKFPKQTRLFLSIQADTG